MHIPVIPTNRFAGSSMMECHRAALSYRAKALSRSSTNSRQPGSLESPRVQKGVPNFSLPVHNRKSGAGSRPSECLQILCCAQQTLRWSSTLGHMMVPKRARLGRTTSGTSGGELLSWKVRRQTITLTRQNSNSWSIHTMFANFARERNFATGNYCRGARCCTGPSAAQGGGVDLDARARGSGWASRRPRSTRNLPSKARWSHQCRSQRATASLQAWMIFR